jgi:hypothetical protein
MRFLLFSLLLTAACTSLHPVPPARLKQSHPLPRVWVTRADQPAMIFDEARVRGDTLVGLVNGNWERLPLSEATTIRARERSGSRTAALGIGLGGGAAVLAYFLVFKPSNDAQACVAVGTPCSSGATCCPTGIP